MTAIVLNKHAMIPIVNVSLTNEIDHLKMLSVLNSGVAGQKFVFKMGFIERIIDLFLESEKYRAAKHLYELGVALSNFRGLKNSPVSRRQCKQDAETTIANLKMLVNRGSLQDFDTLMQPIIDELEFQSAAPQKINGYGLEARPVKPKQRPVAVEVDYPELIRENQIPGVRAIRDNQLNSLFDHIVTDAEKQLSDESDRALRLKRESEVRSRFRSKVSEVAQSLLETPIQLASVAPAKSSPLTDLTTELATDLTTERATEIPDPKNIENRSPESHGVDRQVKQFLSVAAVRLGTIAENLGGKVSQLGEDVAAVFHLQPQSGTYEMPAKSVDVAIEVVQVADSLVQSAEIPTAPVQESSPLASIMVQPGRQLKRIARGLQDILKEVPAFPGLPKLNRSVSPVVPPPATATSRPATPEKIGGP